MIVIEFCGNPGCGKSTICTDLIDTMSEHGYDIHDYNDIKEKRKINNIKYLFSVHAIKNMISCFMFGCQSRISRRTFVYSIKCASILSQLRKWDHTERYGYVVFDEGIIQYLTTLSHDKGINDMKMLEFLKPYYSSKDVFVINCELGIEENSRRLYKRNRTGDRFVIADIEKQCSALQLKRDNLDSVITFLEPEHLIHLSTDRETHDSVIALEKYWVK